MFDRRRGSRSRILAVEETSAGTVLEVGDPVDEQPSRRVRTGSHPDRETARCLLGCNRRADWVVVDPGGSAVLGLCTFRTPRRVRIPLAVALGLAEAGVPAYLSGAPA
ncbi:MAG: hypothetical protein K1X95_10415 [Acidimicrobiia bacterium]|nr:hypothetical protein [Acidimicrobiia bacterium]